MKKIAPLGDENAPNAQKYRSNGEISPNLVTLVRRQKFSPPLMRLN
jgi:hypothetical protein